MTRIMSVPAALLALAGCSTPSAKLAASESPGKAAPAPPGHVMRGPLAVGVSPDAPKDPIGILLGWGPAETIENFKHLDRFFPVRTVRRGPHVQDLPAGDPIDPMVTVQVIADGRLKDTDRKVAIDQLMHDSRITGLIVLHHGRVVLERYAFGRTAQDRWTSNSIAKSFTSTLVGAAIKDGLIGSLEDPITRYLPELGPVPAFDGVTLRHLLIMSSGLKFNEDYYDLTSDVALYGGGEAINGRSPIIAYAMKLVRAHPPGAVEDYQTINTDLVTLALSRVLKPSGRTVSDYLSEKIWRPAGMEADGNWLLEKTGVERGGCCISMRLRDFARFGLFIASGKADAELPPGWIRMASTPVWPFGPIQAGYGLGWWVRPDDSYEGQGGLGQSVTIYPKDDLVVAINSAGLDPGGIGAPRWWLLKAIDDAVAGRPDHNTGANERSDLDRRASP
ncbi:MAG TPA: serine hydrolase domain-containing protein [Hyphomonadaceae bacterium]|nr:serine hydrolase domain-containing protein [Hyphomonadaceae bacterium]